VSRSLKACGAGQQGLDPALRTTDPNARKIFRAMQKYGLIVADNGSDMYITGTFDTRWNNGLLNPAFSTLTASDFEVVALGWNPAASGAALASIAASPGTVVGGNPSLGTVTLTAAAPAGGALVTLSSASSAVSIRDTIAVGAGATSAKFPLDTAVVAATTATTLSASYGGVTRTTTFTLNPEPSPAIAALAVSPASVQGSTGAAGTVTLSSPAPGGGTVIALSSSIPSLAAVPPSVTVAAGATSAAFIVTTALPKKNTAVTISAASAGVTKKFTLKVLAR
jgi:hypothetical protein